MSNDIEFNDDELCKIAQLRNRIGGYQRFRLDIGLSHSMPKTIRWVRRNRRVVVLGFEPNRENYLQCEKLRETLKPAVRNRIFLFNLAIANTESMKHVILYTPNNEVGNADPGLSSLLKPKFVGDLKYALTSSVRCVSLKTLMELMYIKHIQLLKTDTQGFDLQVIESLGPFSNSVTAIIAERDSSDSYYGANSGIEIDSYCESLGFLRAKDYFSRGDQSGIPSDSLYIKAIENPSVGIPFAITKHLSFFPKHTLEVILHNPIELLEVFLDELIQYVGRVIFRVKHFVHPKANEAKK